MNSIAFVTTCKGRLHHIKQTLPTLIAESPSEIILVDYGCPDNTAEWVDQNFPIVKVVRVDDDAGFCLPRARNLGAAQASAPWLCFIDADVKVTPGWLDWLQHNIRESRFYRACFSDIRDPETYGTVVCSRSAFDAIGGYDEAFRGWGGEDDDLYIRLIENSIVQDHYPSGFVEAISHADSERTSFHPIKSVDVQGLINMVYIKLKHHLRERGIGDMSLETRRHMLTTISNSLKSYPVPPKTFKIVLSLKGLSPATESSLSLEITKRRRFKLFGPRKTFIRSFYKQA